MRVRSHLAQRRLTLAWLLGLTCAAAQPLHAAERKVRTAAEAVALVQRAAGYLREHGRARALLELNKENGLFVDGELYVFAFDRDGIELANPVFPLLVGKNMIGLQDPDGIYITRRFLEMAASKAGKGWVDYKWPNPMNALFVERKTSYVERVGELVIGCGLPKAWARR